MYLIYVYCLSTPSRKKKKLFHEMGLHLVHHWILSSRMVPTMQWILIKIDWKSVPFILALKLSDILVSGVLKVISYHTHNFQSTPHIIRQPCPFLFTKFKINYFIPITLLLYSQRQLTWLLVALQQWFSDPTCFGRLVEAGCWPQSWGFWFSGPGMGPTGSQTMWMLLAKDHTGKTTALLATAQLQQKHERSTVRELIWISVLVVGE